MKWGREFVHGIPVSGSDLNSTLKGRHTKPIKPDDSVCQVNSLFVR